MRKEIFTTSNKCSFQYSIIRNYSDVMIQSNCFFILQLISYFQGGVIIDRTKSTTESQNVCFQDGALEVNG